MLGTARLQPCLGAAGGDVERAIELYLWSAEVSGVLHTQISFVEIAVRNALDLILADWNEAQGGQYGRDWTIEGQAAPTLYDTIGGPLRRARRWAQTEADDRPDTHPRSGVTSTHDDVLVQLTFGVWQNLIHSPSSDNIKQNLLWTEATHQAFSNATDSDESRRETGKQLRKIRTLRNRVAHHDNLLDVALSSRLKGMLSLLAKIHPEFPDLAMTRSSLRRLIREDPRKGWHLL
jgi:hypothetical protein